MQSNLKGSLNFLPKHNSAVVGISLHADHYNYKSSLAGANPLESTVTQQSVYGRVTIPLLQSFQLILGGRGAQDDSHAENSRTIKDRVFVSEQGLKWQARKNLQLYLRRDGNYRFPKADELFNVITQKATPLKAQTGVSYEAGLSWHPGKAQIKFSAYELDLDNEIAFLPSTASSAFGQNTNLPPTRRRGILISTQYPIIKHWRIFGQYSYVDGKFSSGAFTGKRIPNVAKNMFRLSSIYSWRDHWQFFGEAVYTGSRYGNGDNANIGPLYGGYTVINVAVHYHYRGWRIGARINNLTNKKYNTYSNCFPNAHQTACSESFYPAPGRNVFFTLRYNWEQA